MIIVTAWNNGKHHPSGAGYGLKISPEDRDAYFKKENDMVTIILGDTNKRVSVNTNKKSFWNKNCRELISSEIGKWLIQNNKATWPDNKPPRIMMRVVDDSTFKITF